jgi:plastocyanin
MLLEATWRRSSIMTARRWTGLVVLALAMMLVGAACGGKGGTTSPGAGGGQSSSSGGGGGGGGYGYGGGGGKSSSGTSSGGGTSAVTLQQTTNLTFVPATFSIKSGSSITMKNVTTAIPHTFTVQGQGIDVTNDPGRSQKVKIDLAPGKYPFFCRFHVSQGMKGTLTVT